jgi:acyl dehydratase
MTEASMKGFIEQSSRFVGPVYVGDTLYSSLEIVELKPGRTTGTVRMASRVLNQRGETVMEGSQTYLLRKRPTE